jgi:hypothetical protein
VNHLTGHACLEPLQRDFSLSDADDLSAYAADLADIKG